MMKKFLSILLTVAMIFSFATMASAEYSDGQFTGKGKGLNGDIEVSVTVEGGKITAVEVLSHQETEGICEPAIEQIPAAIIEKQSADVDVVAGATFTSNGIMEAVKAALSGEAPAEEVPAEIPFEQADIIVIGAGMAGMSTATRAAQLGLNVLVFEQTGAVGGSAMVAGGTILGVNTRMQKEAGIEDSNELCFADFIRLGGAGSFNTEVARLFCELSGPAVDWLDDLGTDFGDRKPYPGVYQPLNVDRNYSGHKGASAFIAGLQGELDKYIGKNAYVALNSRVDSLIVDDQNKVIGVKVMQGDEMKEYLAPATVICTGGYGGAEDILNQYNFDNVLSTSPAFVTGDGFKWLEAMGAAFTNMDFCTAYAGGIRTNDENFHDFGYFNVLNGCLWVDINGNRMANEPAADSKVKSDSWSYADENIVYTVFSPEMLIPDAKVFTTGAWGRNIEEFDPYMTSLIEKGLAFKADTIEDLAKQAGLPEDAFVATINAYNDACANGNDPFGRTEQMVPMANGPFYAVETMPYIMITCGGPMMDTHCRVLTTEGLPIEGVYIAGEIVGMANVGGRNSIGGMGHSNCLVWGKHIAEQIAAELGK